VASIYEEINDLHEETVDIVLAHNWEVRRQRGVEEGHIRPSQQQSPQTYDFESTPISLWYFYLSILPHRSCMYCVENLAE